MVRLAAIVPRRPGVVKMMGLAEPPSATNLSRRLPNNTRYLEFSECYRIEDIAQAFFAKVQTVTV